jgi:hypothetical protein
VKALTFRLGSTETGQYSCTNIHLYGGASGVDGRSERLAGVLRQTVRFMLVGLAGIWIQSPSRNFYV